MWSPRKGFLQISPGFCLLIAWFTLVNGGRALFVILLSASFHELGHWVALRLCGGRVLGVQIGILGAVMQTSCSNLSYGQELFVVLAGPLSNFLCSAVLAGAAPDILGANLILGAFNLLPLRPLDGGRALELLVSWIADPASGDRFARIAGVCAALSLSAVLLRLMASSGGSLWLLPAVFGLVSAAGAQVFPFSKCAWSF